MRPDRQGSGEDKPIEELIPHSECVLGRGGRRLTQLMSCKLTPTHGRASAHCYSNDVFRCPSLLRKAGDACKLSGLLECESTLSTSMSRQEVLSVSFQVESTSCVLVNTVILQETGAHYKFHDMLTRTE